MKAVKQETSVAQHLARGNRHRDYCRPHGPRKSVPLTSILARLTGPMERETQRQCEVQDVFAMSGEAYDLITWNAPFIFMADKVLPWPQRLLTSLGKASQKIKE